MKLSVYTGPELAAVGPHAVPSGHYDDIKAAKLILVFAKAFADDALEPVAIDGPTQMAFRHR